ncbi:hypothetical protein GCM10020295_04870 [Streptomyces cinereospinus]
MGPAVLAVRSRLDGALRDDRRLRLARRARPRRGEREAGTGRLGSTARVQSRLDPLFFAAGRYGLAFLDICLLLAALGATILLFRRRSRTAALLLVPYALWTLYAAALNFALWQLNT